MRPYIVPLLVIVVFLAAFGSLSQKRNAPPAAPPNKPAQAAEAPPRTTWEDRDNTAGASVMAPVFVRQQLKAPRSAKFPGMFELARHTIKIGPQSYKVVSWVDAQNSFGALIRTRYYMELTQVSRDDWRLDQFHVIE